jgi:sensor c-di-GMP phosphodiesterase-like protein
MVSFGGASRQAQLSVNDSAMLIKRYRRMTIAALALLGTALGAAGGYWLGRATLLRSAKRGLSDYASELVRHADEYAGELYKIKKSFDPSPYPYCSPQELAEMQALTFGSLQVKEIGRTRNGKLDCSAFLGRLNPPIEKKPPTMTLKSGTRVYLKVPLLIAAMAPGTILESGDVSVVLSPNAFDFWRRPHVRFMVMVVNRETGQAGQIGGDTIDVDTGWMLAERERKEAGVLYRSRCSTQYAVCVVTAESAGDILTGSRTLLLEYSGLGGIAGFSLGLTFAQFFLGKVGLVKQLRRAIRKDAISLVYQPILELPSRRFVGAEALVRWSDEDGVPVAPDFFVRIAEDKGFINELTAAVISRAARELGNLLVHNPDFTLSINVAASDLEGDELMPLLEKHILDSGITPAQIALEVTERSTASTASLQRAIHDLHSHGYQIHIDDFGTGFSSLHYLHDLAVDAIKIDRSFTKSSGTDAVTSSILPQILSMAESVKVGVIVEGVETESQLAFLESTGKPMCAQGWYFGRPVAAPALIANHKQSKAAVKAGVV